MNSKSRGKRHTKNTLHIENFQEESCNGRVGGSFDHTIMHIISKIFFLRYTKIAP